MQSACYARSVAHIQIRNVPPEIHRTMKKRAAKAGMSLQEYLLAEITDWASLPTPDEMYARIQRRGAVQTKTDPADIIRQDRDSR